MTYIFCRNCGYLDPEDIGEKIDADPKDIAKKIDAYNGFCFGCADKVSFRDHRSSFCTICRKEHIKETDIILYDVGDSTHATSEHLGCGGFVQLAEKD
jgi:hypothetical protein